MLEKLVVKGFHELKKAFNISKRLGMRWIILKSLQSDFLIMLPAIFLFCNDSQNVDLHAKATIPRLST